MTSKTDEITREYFNSMLITPRYLDVELPDTTIDIFGHKYDTPVMTAALSHLNNTCEDGMVEFAKGAKEVNALHFVGIDIDHAISGKTQTYSSRRASKIWCF